MTADQCQNWTQPWIWIISFNTFLLSWPQSFHVALRFYCFNRGREGSSELAGVALAQCTPNSHQEDFLVSQSTSQKIMNTRPALFQSWSSSRKWHGAKSCHKGKLLKSEKAHNIPSLKGEFQAKISASSPLSSQSILGFHSQTHDSAGTSSSLESADAQGIKTVAYIWIWCLRATR